ncbi:hypothetical protein MPER_07394 [Moniliophthora perniciosa FA553]|nr:hypothetical protein MPER_07394 [Moniliophthora perniciosa FA553]
MANRNVIEFYDIPGSGGVVWSPSTWKIRYALNYKGLEYQTKWIEFPDIESTCKKLGVPPTKTRRDGSPWYTLPAIYDPSTGVALVDSLRIAEYLEKQYPDKPSLIPSGTLALHTAFNEAAEFLTRKWTMELGMPLDEFYPKPENQEAE